jgi:hypothetical protein
MKIADMTKPELFAAIRKWAEAGTLDPRIVSKPTAKNHIHRVGKAAAPSKGKSSHALAREKKRHNRNLVREVLGKAGPK